MWNLRRTGIAFLTLLELATQPRAGRLLSEPGSSLYYMGRATLSLAPLNPVLRAGSVPNGTTGRLHTFCARNGSPSTGGKRSWDLNVDAVALVHGTGGLRSKPQGRKWEGNGAEDSRPESSGAGIGGECDGGRGAARKGAKWVPGTWREHGPLGISWRQETPGPKVPQHPK